MKKRTKILIIIAVIILTGALFMSYFSQKNESGGEPGGKGTEQTNSIEAALPTLLEDGYEQTDDGYVLSVSEDGVGSETVINASGNDMELILNLEYGDGNSNMKTYYKEQDEAVNVMVSAYLTKLAESAGAEDATMHYTIYVGDDKVCDDSMTLQEATEYQELAAD